MLFQLVAALALGAPAPIPLMTALAPGAPAPIPLTGSACDLIALDEKLCTCMDMVDKKFILDCEIPLKLSALNFSDSVGMKVLGDPCTDPASLSIDVVEKNFAIDMPVQTITCGSSLLVPIPGLSFNVPEVGMLSIDVDVEFDGTIDKLHVQAGINACVKAQGRQMCGEEIPWLQNLLPIYLIDGTWNFGSVCASRETATA
jgi:hypothetical protein